MTYLKINFVYLKNINIQAYILFSIFLISLRPNIVTLRNVKLIFLLNQVSLKYQKFTSSGWKIWVRDKNLYFWKVLLPQIFLSSSMIRKRRIGWIEHALYWGSLEVMSTVPLNTLRIASFLLLDCGDKNTILVLNQNLYIVDKKMFKWNLNWI